MPSKKDVNDLSTHKWMLYVRGPNEEPHIDHFVDKVIFLLHDSYKPKNIVTVTYVSEADSLLNVFVSCLLVYSVLYCSAQSLVTFGLYAFATFASTKALCFQAVHLQS